jgi:hypothetical protein
MKSLSADRQSCLTPDGKHGIFPKEERPLCRTRNGKVTTTPVKSKTTIMWGNREDIGRGITNAIARLSSRSGVPPAWGRVPPG